jgi:glycosyltransferase involved in cell wall biosynthesis
MVLGISIVVPVYNEEDRLERCLDSILNQAEDIPIEVLCIDDGSSDDSPNILRTYESRYERLHVFTHEQNQGYASTISNGLEQANESIVAFLDADSYLADGSLSNLVGEFREGADAVFGKVTVGNPDAGLHPTVCMVGKRHDTTLQFGGALMAFDRSVLMSEGSFDLTAERAGQDVEIRDRLTALGYDVILDEDIVVYSDFPTELRSILARKYLAGKTYVLAYVDNPEAFDLSVLQGFLFYLTFDVTLLLSAIFPPLLLALFGMLAVFVWFYSNKASEIARTADTPYYYPAYFCYEFVAGQLRFAGYLSVLPKFLSLVRRNL